MNKKLQFYKAEYKDRTVYYYYTEQKVFVSRKCYLNGFFIVFGIATILFILSKWHFCKVDMASLWTYYELILATVWLFLIKLSIKSLQIYASQVQILKKVRIEYKDGNISELTNF